MPRAGLAPNANQLGVIRVSHTNGKDAVAWGRGRDFGLLQTTQNTSNTMQDMSQNLKSVYEGGLAGGAKVMFYSPPEFCMHILHCMIITPSSLRQSSILKKLKAANVPISAWDNSLPLEVYLHSAYI